MSNCNECKSGKGSESIYEAICARNERTIRRLIFALVFAIFLLFAANAAWLWAWVQYDYTGTETVYQQDGEGLNIIGDSNEAVVNDGADGS